MKCALNPGISAAPIEEYCISPRFTSPSLACFPRLCFPICFFMAIAEARRDKERNLSHLYDSATPGFGPLLLEQHNYDISRPVVKVQFLSVRMATRVLFFFSAVLRNEEEHSEHSSVSQHLKRIWIAGKPPNADWLIKVRQHPVNPTIPSAASYEITSLHPFGPFRGRGNGFSVLIHLEHQVSDGSQ